MTADIGEQLNAIRIAHQHLRIAVQHVIVAQVGHHQFMADVVRPFSKQHAAFGLQYFGVEVPAHRWLRDDGIELLSFGYFGHTHDSSVNTV